MSRTFKDRAPKRAKIDRKPATPKRTRTRQAFVAAALAERI